MKFCLWIAVCLLLCSFEEPNYKVLYSEDNLEQREYPPMTIAEVRLKGHRKDVLKKGFRILAEYIFGNNSLNQKITMTAPVTEQSTNEISLIMPVQQQMQELEWSIRFILPNNYSYDQAPKPTNQEIYLKAIPAMSYAAIRFSGRTGDESIIPQFDKLQNFISQQNLKVTGRPIFAYYNPPWTLPFLRRNEILIPIQKE